MDYVLFAILCVLGLVVVLLYLRNLVLAIQAVKNKEYTAHTGIRVVGIFVAFIGVIMGLVK
jgi:hypothetical protein